MSASKPEITEFLVRLPLFGDLEPVELARIAEQTTELRVPRGGTIFRQGDASTGFYCVIHGRVKLSFTSEQGEEKVVEIVGPGGSFGEALMFMDKPYIVSSQALADTMVLHVSKPAVLEELELTPRFARRMLAGLSRRLHGLISDVEAYSLASGTQRVIGYLLREEHVDGDEVHLQVGKAVLASRLNLTPEHFSRVLHDLTGQQLIEVHGRSITILDVEKLRRYDR